MKIFTQKLNNIIKMCSRKLVFLYIFLALSIAANIYLFVQNAPNSQDSKSPLQQKEAKYPLLSKRVLSDIPIDILINFLDLRNSLKQKVADYKDNLALYFEYLPTGTSIGIHATDEFYAASLFKLPVVMAYFRHKERSNIASDIKVKITQDQLDNRFGSLWQKGAGYEIGLDEAAKLSLTESDNTAAKVLGPYITDEDFKDVYDAVDIDLRITDKGAVMTPKNYSSILKALYFSAVLNYDDSQTILSYLTESEFNDKLTAGTPKGIAVAHKIGVIDEESYMDCGIVYVPLRNYLLCMVSKGTEKEAQDRMSTVSKIVYDFVIKTQGPIGK